MNIAGKVVLLTGASQGIGLATARFLTQKGARVALVARSAESIEQLAKELPDSLAIPTDMRDEQAIRHMVSQAFEQYGRIDILINNAGQGMHVPIEKADLQQYRDVFELNVVSVIAAMQAVIPIMRQQQGGLIINISSGTSKMVLPGIGPYASTKYALNAITLTARMELAGDNIRVGLVHPGITESNFNKNLISGRQYGLGRPGGPPVESSEQVAGTILKAIESEDAETYADSIQDLAASMRRG
jgi:NADP-dependent 3-hydroxy acid dehydrogenase YdfG